MDGSPQRRPYGIIDGMEAARPVVRKALRSDVDAVARVLAESFDADPLMRFLIPDEGYRRRLTALFVFETALTPRGAWVAVQDGEIAGAALWGPPRTPSPGLRELLRGSPNVIRAFGLRLPTALRAFRVIEDAHPKTPPHWYLQTLGAARPGRGIGRALLRDGLARVDATRLPAYLESSSDSNIPIYERYGFRVTGTIPLPRGGPTLTTMWRDPKQGTPGERG